MLVSRDGGHALLAERGRHVRGVTFVVMLICGCCGIFYDVTSSIQWTGLPGVRCWKDGSRSTPAQQRR
jgi:hypothetical protein